MKQIWIPKAGGPEVLRLDQSPDPMPKNGEIRIRVEAVGVNFADIMGRMGVYPDAPAIPFVPGYEVAGTVDQVMPGVTGFQEGDKVLALTRFGGYSDVVCVPHKQAFKRFDWMNAQDGAALLVNYLTAYQMLVVMGSAKPGDKALIHGVGGGVGLAALDICRIIGAEPIGTASAHKHEFLKERGLDVVIDHRQDFGRVALDLTNGRGPQIILDPVGGQLWHKNYRLLAPAGRLICYGISSGVAGKKRSLWHLFKAAVNLRFYTPVRLMSDNKGVLGVNLAHLWEYTDEVRRWMGQIMSWYDEALFRPHIDRAFPFTEAAAAHDYIQERKNIGKVLLIP